MKRRFTIIQGGLAERASHEAPGGTLRACGWRVVLRRPVELGPDEIVGWRALCGGQAMPDPFADPDYLSTTARQTGRGSDVAFAFAYAGSEAGGGVLRGVLPLVLPHPVWGGSTIRLWHPPLAMRPVEPVFEAGAAAAAVEAILRHVQDGRPRTGLRLGRIAAEGRLIHELRADNRLWLDIHPHEAIPAAHFVDIGLRDVASEIERITDLSAMRDAVERFLLVDAQRSRRPLIADPSEASIVGVVTRLFAKRGLACVEFGHRGGEVVSGAIRLGEAKRRALWRAANLGESVPTTLRSADVDVAVADVALFRPRPARLSLVAP